MENISNEQNALINTENHIQIDSNNKSTQPNKGKLKNLFDQIDNENKKLKLNKNKKNEKTKIISNSNSNKNSQDNSEKYKTKPTKPDFTQQFIEHGILGLNLKDESNQYKGLINFGNICYSNVTIQCLNALKEFVYMLNTIYKRIEDLDKIDSDYPVLCNLVKIMNYYQGI